MQLLFHAPSFQHHKVALVLLHESHYPWYILWCAFGAFAYSKCINERLHDARCAVRAYLHGYVDIGCAINWTKCNCLRRVFLQKVGHDDGHVCIIYECQHTHRFVNSNLHPTQDLAWQERQHDNTLYNILRQTWGAGVNQNLKGAVRAT